MQPVILLQKSTHGEDVISRPSWSLLNQTNWARCAHARGLAYARSLMRFSFRSSHFFQLPVPIYISIHHFHLRVARGAAQLYKLVNIKMTAVAFIQYISSGKLTKWVGEERRRRRKRRRRRGDVLNRQLDWSLFFITSYLKTALTSDNSICTDSRQSGGCSELNIMEFSAASRSSECRGSEVDSAYLYRICTWPDISNALSPGAWLGCWEGHAFE